jgi:WD40 repeat protein
MPHACRRAIGVVALLACLAAAPVSPAAAPPPLLRDRYGDPLPVGAKLRLGTVRSPKDRSSEVGHRRSIHAAAFTADGRQLVSVGEYTLRVWDLTSGRQRHCVRLERVSNRRILRLSADGSLALVGADWLGGASNAVDLTRGRVLWKHQLPGAGFGGIGPSRPGFALTTDGRLAVVPFVENRLVGRKGALVRDARTGREMLLFLGNYDSDEPVFSPDGTILAFVGSSEITLHEARTGRFLQRFPRKPARFDDPRPFAFAPDGRTIASIDANRLQVLERSSGIRLLHTRLPEGFTPTLLAILDKGRLLVAGFRRTEDGRVCAAVWDATSRCFLRTTPVLDNPAPPLALSPDGSLLAVGSSGSDLVVWEVAGPDSPLEAALSPERAAELWSSFGFDNLAWEVMRRLADSPTQTLNLFQERVKAAPIGQLTTLLADLDDEKFPVREAASRNLTDLLRRGTLRWLNNSAEVEQGLRCVLAGKTSPEVRSRLERVLGLLRGRSLPLSLEQRRHLRAVMVLERIGSPQAVALLKKLAAGPPSLLTREARDSLERLDRRMR